MSGRHDSNKSPTHRYASHETFMISHQSVPVVTQSKPIASTCSTCFLAEDEVLRINSITRTTLIHPHDKSPTHRYASHKTFMISHQSVPASSLSQRHLLSVPHHRRTFGRRAFAVAGPMVWNSLPHDLRNLSCCDSYFRRFLKSIFFSFY